MKIMVCHIQDMEAPVKHPGYMITSVKYSCLIQHIFVLPYRKCIFIFVTVFRLISSPHSTRFSAHLEGLATEVYYFNAYITVSNFFVHITDHQCWVSWMNNVL